MSLNRPGPRRRPRGGIVDIASIDVQRIGGAVSAFPTDAGGRMPNVGSPRFHEGHVGTGRRP